MCLHLPYIERAEDAFRQSYVADGNRCAIRPSRKAVEQTNMTILIAAFGGWREPDRRPAPYLPAGGDLLRRRQPGLNLRQGRCGATTDHHQHLAVLLQCLRVVGQGQGCAAGWLDQYPMIEQEPLASL